jgi:tRNA (mo5U34)-methyltransferase
MPTTRPRTLRIGGLEVSATMDRMLAEKIKATKPYRWLRRNPEPQRFEGGAPALNGQQLTDIEWYHTIDLGNGVATPGFVDHRSQVDLYRLPADLRGKRCLDVATYDGFWAFEMEKRGAAEVIGIDLFGRADSDFPTNYRKEYLEDRPHLVKGFGFAYAARALNSRVQRKVLSVYELSPDRVGSFDFVFMSDLLLHLRDPLRALEAVWSVTRPGGEAIIADAYDKDVEATGIVRALRFMAAYHDHYSGGFWWAFSSTSLEAMIQLARFDDVQKIAQFDLPTQMGIDVPKVVFKARRGT